MNIPDVPQVAGVCKMLVDNDEAARNAFHNLNIKFWEEKVLLLRAPDRPGLFATVRERWLRKRSLWSRGRAHCSLRFRH
jgi:hypothetical protein